MEAWWRRNSANWTTARPILGSVAKCLAESLLPIGDADARRHLFDLGVMFPGRAEDVAAWDDRYRLYLKSCSGHSAGAWQHAVDELARTREAFYPSPAELLKPMNVWTGRCQYRVDLVGRLSVLEPPPAAGEAATLAEVLQLRAKYQIAEQVTSEPRRAIQGHPLRDGPGALDGG